MATKKVRQGLIPAYVGEKRVKKRVPEGFCFIPENVLKCKLQPTVWLITIHAAVNLFAQCHQYFTLQNNSN